MDNLRAVIKNLFCYVSSQEILKEHVMCDNINEETFRQLGSGYIMRYSNDELSNMYYFLESEFLWQNRRLKGEMPTSDNDGDVLNVFDALVAFDHAVLIEENGMPLCQYVQLLRWRDMITVLEEDLFITSFLAYNDVLMNRARNNFFWKPVIGHNNRALNCLVAKGVAENHFHMKGSAPQFHLSWISLMNQIDKSEFDGIFEKYEKNRLQRNLNLNVDYPGSRLSDMWRQAALIRLFLFAVLKGDYLEFEGTNDSVNPKQYSLRKVRELLNDSGELKEYSGMIQDNINRFREEYGKRDLDYTICEGYLAYNGEKDTNGPLSGERWFMYRMFSAIYRKDSDMEPYFNWFYAYLVIKANIRRELVQANANVGFDNFKQYQDRKDLFVENSKYESIYVRMAVRDTIYNQHIESLEARIAPKMDMQGNLKSIKKYDRWITESLSVEEKQKLYEKYFYVVHFVKEGERNQKDFTYLEEYRHYRKRDEVKKQALAIAALRESGAVEAGRIRGIDACSPEIWCRPEVFAQAFRYLKNHWGSVMDDGELSKSLLATYHAGEDFLDVTDGLRAIDEAIQFLNLRCGDRLGHALALGVDIEEWYESKSYRILINKMGYLDNLVWLYAKLRKYNIEGCEEVKSYIEKRFHEYFGEIYRNNMVKETMQSIVNSAKAYFDQFHIAHSYKHDNLSFGIDEYYEAWKLRGDDPELYREGFFKVQGKIMDEWDEYAINKEFPQNYKIRYNPETAILYYMYHYDPNVKLIGDQMVEIKVSHNMIQAIKKVRDVMQREICNIGIGIETNPSSNYLIGTFRRYDRHPIKKWYNYGLTTNQKELEECPQLQVSINTDDQGVFSTYIENEYAYLALALEKCRDAKGNPVYNRTMVLQWLDNIRRMGIDQSFK